MAAPPNLQEAIDQAGSPINLIWKPNAPAWVPPVVDPEYSGWAAEQRAGYETASLSDLSHHMRDLFIKGPDATKLLADYSANNYEKFVVGQAKQFVPVNENGDIITDGILMRRAENEYVLTGPPASMSWILYHGQKGDYKVEFEDDPDSEFRGSDPVLSRYQIQGPNAMDIVSKVFGGPLPETKFFHSTPAVLDGREYRAFRHGMAGQPGYEFIGAYSDGEFLREALMQAGEEFDIVRVGALAYATNGIESGWIPTPTPGIYTDPKLKDYRESLSLFSYEGQKPLQGTHFSENIEDFYCSPWELGYGRSISFNHDFYGRDALQASKDKQTRTKVTLVLDKDDAQKIVASGEDYYNSYGRYRIEADGKLVGTTFYTGNIARHGTVLSLSLIDNEYAKPGTDVTFVYGSHPGAGTDPEADLGFDRLKATVQPAPYDDFARTGYRKD